jgi:sulfite exporter TauE/SafE
MSKQVNNNEVKLAFEKRNYIFMAIGVVLIILGLVFLTGGGSRNPDVFNPEIFSVRRLYVAPLLMLAGFIIEIYAIMWKPKKEAE